MSKVLATIGYEGASLEAFDAALHQAGIELVIDVRAVAVSRRRGFSKSSLRDRLEAAGLRYVHLRGLGDPKPGRVAARAGDMARFRTIFSAHLETPEAQGDLSALTELVGTHRAALLCFEADAASCHRTMISDHIAMLANLSILHLRVEPERAGVVGRSRTDNHPREGMASA